MPSCRVGRVLVDVLGRQVVGPDRGGGVAGVQVHGDGDVAAGEVDLGAVLGGGAGPADPYAVHRHVELVGFEAGAGGADGGEHAAPVGVVAVQGAFEQVVAGDRAADPHRVVLAGRAEDLDGDILCAPVRLGE